MYNYFQLCKKIMATSVYICNNTSRFLLKINNDSDEAASGIETMA
jgi:hypothetical protein